MTSAATPDDARNYAELVADYAGRLQRYRETEIHTVRDDDDVENQTRDAGHDAHYLAVGQQAAELTIAQLIAHRRPAPRRVLDYASGSGRVTRHLCAMYPDAEIGCLDLYDEHLDFVDRHFDVTTIRGAEDPADVQLDPVWDLVFSGSLLTHLPERFFWPTIDAIARGLSPTGIALVTLEGRRAEEIQDTAWKLIEDDRFDRIRRAYRRKGFGFADYSAPMKKLFPSQQQYGIALVAPSWVMRGLEQRSELRVLGYVERAWDEHQDVMVFGRPGAIG